jgi:hypothetical protein
LSSLAPSVGIPVGFTGGGDGFVGFRGRRGRCIVELGDLRAAVAADVVVGLPGRHVAALCDFAC